MSRPRTTPLARDDSPAAMMAAGVPGEDDDLDAAASGTRGAKHRRRPPGRTRTPESPVKHRPAPAAGRQVEPQCLTDASGAWPALRMPVLPLLDVRHVRTAPLAKRASKAGAIALGKRLEPGLTVADFLSRLPDLMAAADLRIAADAIATARLGGRGVVLGMGAHPIEAGLSPLIVDLMERRVITAVALDGAGVIRDFELALAGRTSEDDGTRLDRGRARIAHETGETLNRLAREAASADEGLGMAIGRHVAASRYPHRTASILAAGARLDIPVTAHVAIGSDVVHVHPSADGAAIGAASMKDFHRLASVVAGLADGVCVNLGPAGVVPAVFTKALALGRSLGHSVRELLTIDLDLVHRDHRAASDASRPGVAGERRLHITGHHELLLPLLAAAVLERIAASRAARKR